jgi:hypothetical protein
VRSPARLFDHECRALQGRTADDELVTELHRVGHNTRQCADIQSHPVNPPAGSPLDDHVDNALGNGKLVH